MTKAERTLNPTCRTLERQTLPDKKHYVMIYFNLELRSEWLWNFIFRTTSLGTSLTQIVCYR
jgi:hypothetical protein